jgi:hypothetical protein
MYTVNVNEGRGIVCFHKFVSHVHCSFFLAGLVRSVNDGPHKGTHVGLRLG